MYTDEFGVQYSDDKKTLMKCPRDFKGGYVIPDGVTEIGYGAFSGCTGLTSVTIPESVTDIGDKAFEDCYLVSIEIPNSVTSIGDAAFYCCSRLTSVTIPNSVTSIGKYAFMYCTGLTSVHISDIAAWCAISFGIIGSNPLSYAHNLYLNDELITELVIPDNVTSIGDDAFAWCDGLTSIVIPDSVTSIGDDAFGGCSRLTSVTIGNSVTSIGEESFAWCDGLTSVTIPKSVTSIGDHAFEDCDSLTSVTIPDSVTSIGNSAFLLCRSLTSIVIPDSVTSIGNSAFSGCKSLTSVTIGNSVTSIGDDAFAWCDGLTSVTIPNSVTEIGDYAFRGCEGLTSVIIPDSVTEIGFNAFQECKELTSITIGNGVTRIKGCTFYKCYKLNSMTISNSLIKIDWSAFGNEEDDEWCPLRKIIIPRGSKESFTELENYYKRRFVEKADPTAYFDEQGVEYSADRKTLVEAPRTIIGQYVIPDGITEIRYNAFDSCERLTFVTIPDSVQKIGNEAFRDCTGLTSVIIPDSVRTVGDNIFCHCRSLTSIVIGKNVQNIGTYGLGLFYGCSSLESIKVSEGNPQYDSRNNCNAIVETESNQLIVGCKNTVIPDGIKIIGARAFLGCSGLTTIAIPDSVTDIEEYAFAGCDYLESIVVSAEAKERFYRMEKLSGYSQIIMSPDDTKTSFIHNVIPFPGFNESILESTEIVVQAYRNYIDEIIKDHPTFQIENRDLEFQKEQYEDRVAREWTDAYYTFTPKGLVQSCKFLKVVGPTTFNDFGNYIMISPIEGEQNEIYVKINLAEDWLDRMKKFIANNEEWFALHVKDNKECSDKANCIDEWIHGLERYDNHYRGATINYMMEYEDEKVWDKINEAAIKKVPIRDYISMLGDKKEKYEKFLIAEKKRKIEKLNKRLQFTLDFDGENDSTEEN